MNSALGMAGIAPQQFLFTDASFIFVAAYIESSFMILPIANAIEELPENLENARRDLGAKGWQTFTKVVWPLTMLGVKSGG